MNQENFHQLIILLRALCASINKNTKAINKKDTTKNDAPEPPPVVIITGEVGLPSAIRAYYEAEQNERPTNKNWTRIKRGIEIAAFFSALAAAVFTLLTLNQITIQTDISKKQLNTLKEQFTLSERPWVGISSGIKITGNYGREINPQSAGIEFKLADYGHSPAIVGRMIFVMGQEMGNTRMKNFDSYATCQEPDQDLDDANPRRSSIVVFPGEPLPQEVIASVKNPEAPLELLIGCIAYKSAGGGAIYHTEVGYRIESELHQEGPGKGRRVILGLELKYLRAD